MRLTPLAVALLLTACPAPPSGPGPSTDAGSADGGTSSGDGGTTAGSGETTLTWTTVGVPGSQCAKGAQASLGYARGAADQLVVFLQGGGACWNTGTCHPSWVQWGPVCAYGAGTICLWDNPGGTKPLATYVDQADPFPADGGGAFPTELGTLRDSLLFQRRPENPLRDASFAFIPYCTGDLHAGAATRTYQVKTDAAGQAVTVTHHFAGATNMDAFLAWLRAQHPQVRVLWLVGVSAGGYGAQLNLHRVRAAFPEAEVHLLADSAPMLTPNTFGAWLSEWNLQLPTPCNACDAGLPKILAAEAAAAPTTRLALLASDEDQVITRFFFAAPDPGSWLNPPYATYTQALHALEQSQYVPGSNLHFWETHSQDHVLLGRYGVVQSDGGVSAPAKSADGGSLKDWVDAWATGDGGWDDTR